MEKDDITRRDFASIAFGAGLAAAAGADLVAQGQLVETNVDIKTPDGTCDAAFIHPASGHGVDVTAPNGAFVKIDGFQVQADTGINSVNAIDLEVRNNRISGENAATSTGIAVSGAHSALFAAGSTVVVKFGILCDGSGVVTATNCLVTTPFGSSGDGIRVSNVGTTATISRPASLAIKVLNTCSGAKPSASVASVP